MAVFGTKTRPATVPTNRPIVQPNLDDFFGDKKRKEDMVLKVKQIVLPEVVATTEISQGLEMLELEIKERREIASKTVYRSEMITYDVIELAQRHFDSKLKIEREKRAMFESAVEKQLTDKELDDFFANSGKPVQKRPPLMVEVVEIERKMVKLEAEIKEAENRRKSEVYEFITVNDKTIERATAVLDDNYVAVDITGLPSDIDAVPEVDLDAFYAKCEEQERKQQEEIEEFGIEELRFE